MWLITGANGFVGQRLARRMHDEDLPLRLVSRSPVTLSSKRVESLIVPHIGSSTDWSEALEGVTGIVHLAARAHVLRETAESPRDEYFEVNRDGTLGLAEAASQKGVRHFIFLSTVGVHGRLTYDSPFQETDPACPHNDYTESKWAAEEGLRALSKRSDLDVTIIRPPLVYGPGVPANFLRLLKLVRSGIPLPFSTLANKRSFVSVDSLVDLVVTCTRDPRARNEEFLVSDREDLSTKELILQLAELMQKRVFMFPFPIAMLRSIGKLLGKESAVDGLLGSLQVNAEKAKSLLEWSPPITLTDGLRDTVRDYLDEQTTLSSQAIDARGGAVS